MRLAAAVAFIAWSLLSGCASFQHPFAGWSDRDKAIFAVNVGCHALDTAQTAWAMGEPGFKEMNPIFGSDPDEKTVIGLKALALGATYWANDISPPETRTGSLLMVTIPCLAVVAWNHEQGARP